MNATTPFNELVYWHSRSYGKAFRIKKSIIRALFTIGCIITPCTNWALIFLPKIQDWVVRW